MSSILKLELPADVVEPMRDAAQRSGQSLEEWAVTQLRRSAPTASDREAALARLLQFTVDDPDAVGGEIDADLARP